MPRHPVPLPGRNVFGCLGRKLTGKDVIDFVKYRQLLAEGHALDPELHEAVLPKPK